MGFPYTTISLFVARVTFLHAQKSDQKGHFAQCYRPQANTPPLGKEACALFIWLVLRTAPYEFDNK